MTGSGRRPPPPPVSTAVCRAYPVSRLRSGRSSSGCPREARLQPTLGRSKPVGTNRPGRGRQLLTGALSEPPGRPVQPGLCYRERPAKRLRSVAIGRASPPPPPPPPAPYAAAPAAGCQRVYSRACIIPPSTGPGPPNNPAAGRLGIRRPPSAEPPPPRTVARQKRKDCGGRTLAGRVQLVHMLLYGDWR